MGVFKSINPSGMVVTEVTGKHNSPVFVNCFIEVLFHFSAYFDCVEDCMVRDIWLRMQSEAIYLGYLIRNMILAEDEERMHGHVNLDIWKAFFYWFDMKEEELSSSSLMQASLVVKTYACRNLALCIRTTSRLFWDGKVCHFSTFPHGDLNRVT